MTEKLASIEETFFSHVAEDENDLDEIKARGEAGMMQDAGDTVASVKIQ